MRLIWTSFIAGLFACGLLAADDFEIGNRRFTLPPGFTIELAAGPPTAERPISADIDYRGRLYVTESSGSNDNVQTQLKQKPHQILCLEDTNGNGCYDQRTVFADHMMFPEGALWHDGSLYAAAPPIIWKLTDTDDDGVADERIQWFDGRTLTGCANDLHGPYVGWDGWIYWCKGAFAEQTHKLTSGDKLTTRAAHVFRRKPTGGPIEVVMTGGMDNPVELVFTHRGERIFSTTFLQHPGGGRRDGLIHAIYGGVYGKEHGVLDGHVRTGDLMPPLVHLGAAAPSALAIMETERWGADCQGNLFAALFNMHKVTRHVLTPQGATFASSNSDFVVCDSLDFHPTDVLFDADGSMLILDTGGWYKLCCPTSQLAKPDVRGAIYRVRKTDASGSTVASGSLNWTDVSPNELVRRLSCENPVARKHSMEVLAKHGSNCVPSLLDRLGKADANTRVTLVWMLTRIDDPRARAAIVGSLQDESPAVRQAAIHSIGVHRHAMAFEPLASLLGDERDPQVRRAAAEALGRLRDSRAVERLIEAAAAKGIASEYDRIQEHSLIYALIEIGDPAAVRQALRTWPAAKYAAVIALDQMPAGELSPDEVVPLLNTRHHKTAMWVIDHHPEWADALLPYIRRQLTSSAVTPKKLAEVEPLLAQLASDATVQELLATTLADNSIVRSVKSAVLRSMSQSKLPRMPAKWCATYANMLRSSDDESTRSLLIDTVAAFESIASDGENRHIEALNAALADVARGKTISRELRLGALTAYQGQLTDITSETFSMLLSAMAATNPAGIRARAVELLERIDLSDKQAKQLVDNLANVNSLELNQIVRKLAGQSSAATRLQLVKSLATHSSAAVLSRDDLTKSFAAASEEVRSELDQLIAKLEAEKTKQRDNLQHILESLPAGDIRRGQVVFHGEKAACKVCHAMGYLGGDLGPDMTRIGGIRSKSDLLESILFPNQSFVRSYEPVSVTTNDGRTVAGLMREERGGVVVITNSERKEFRVERKDIDEITPSNVSIMPTGLDKQLTPQQLADLLAFLSAQR